MKIIREKIYEEFLGNFQTEYDQEYELYVNPKSIKRMNGWVRAVSDENGDLYVATPSTNVVHSDIIEEIPHLSEFKVYDNFKNINWQQKDETVEFYLGEGYTEDDFEEGGYDGEFIYEEILPAYVAVQKKNPQYKFILRSINSI